MKKTALFVLSVVLLMALLCPAVYADIIYTPDLNRFYDAHYKECEYVNRVYTVNEGGAEAFKSPEDTKSLGTVAAGSVLRISHVYIAPDGTQWGVQMYSSARDGFWLAMSSLTVVYDRVSFEEQYGHAFVEFDAQKYTVPTEGKARFWSYPNSGVVSNLAYNFDESLPQSITKVYVDEAGCAWGYISYYYGSRDVWVALLDDSELLKTAVTQGRIYPIDEEDLNSGVIVTTVVTPVDISAPSVTPGDLPTESDTDLQIEQPHISYAEPQNEWVLPTVIAAVLAAAAGVLIVIFIRKNKSAKGN